MPALTRLAPLFALVLTQCALPNAAQQLLSRISPPAAGTPATVAEAPSEPTVKRAQSAQEGEKLFPTASGFNVPQQSSALNDTARVLAGLPPAGRDTLPQIRSSAAWQNHKNKLDQVWADFAGRHEQPIRAWASSQIGDLQSSSLFYPFSGPDFLFAHTFFPRADTLVLCGLEPCEPLPALAQLNPGELSSGLDGLVTSLDTVMQFSFFITKDMRRDLENTRFRGVLPIILTFMARSGYSVESIDLARIDGSGTPIIVGGSDKVQGAIIRARAPGGGLCRVFYFRQDLSDDGLKADGPFLRFVSSLGNTPAFVKSASYLMQEGGFSTIRNYLLTHSRGIVQDPSGIAFAKLNEAGWNTTLYGNYQGTLDLFPSHQQPDLIEAYRKGQGKPLSFGIGYLYNPERTCLMVSRPTARR